MPPVIREVDPRTGEQTDPMLQESVPDPTGRAVATMPGAGVDLARRHADYPAGAVTRQYEFGPEHNRVFNSLARTMLSFGAVLMVFGIVQLIFSLNARRDDMPAPLVPGVLGLLFGALLVHSAAPFRQIVVTQGSDITHLMEALGRLRFTFLLQTALAVMAVFAAVFVLWVNR